MGQGSTEPDLEAWRLFLTSRSGWHPSALRQWVRTNQGEWNTIVTGMAEESLHEVAYDVILDCHIANRGRRGNSTVVALTEQGLLVMINWDKSAPTVLRMDYDQLEALRVRRRLSGAQIVITGELHEHQQWRVGLIQDHAEAKRFADEANDVRAAWRARGAGGLVSTLGSSAPNAPFPDTRDDLVVALRDGYEVAQSMPEGQRGLDAISQEAQRLHDEGQYVLSYHVTGLATHSLREMNTDKELRSAARSGFFPAGIGVHASSLGEMMHLLQGASDDDNSVQLLWEVSGPLLRVSVEHIETLATSAKLSRSDECHSVEVLVGLAVLAELLFIELAGRPGGDLVREVLRLASRRDVPLHEGAGIMLTRLAETDIDVALPDAEDSAWFDNVYARHQGERSRLVGHPEEMLAHTESLRRNGDFGVAMIVAQRALNSLEDSYALPQMSHRAPSRADQPIVDSFLECVLFSKRAGHEQTCRRVAGAASRNLRICADAARNAGDPSDLYASALDWLDEIFPDLEESESL